MQSRTQNYLREASGKDGICVWGGGDQATEDYEPTWDTYSNHTVAHAEK